MCKCRWFMCGSNGAAPRAPSSECEGSPAHVHATGAGGSLIKAAFPGRLSTSATPAHPPMCQDDPRQLPVGERPGATPNNQLCDNYNQFLPTLPDRMTPDRCWEASGEELHSFIEDGLAKHLKLQASARAIAAEEAARVGIAASWARAGRGQPSGVRKGSQAFRSRCGLLPPSHGAG